MPFTALAKESRFLSTKGSSLELEGLVFALAGTGSWKVRNGCFMLSVVGCEGCTMWDPKRFTDE